MGDWFKKRLESILDNLVFAGVVAVGIAVWSAMKSLPLPLIIGISGGIFVLILVIIRLTLFYIKRKSRMEEANRTIKEREIHLIIGILENIHKLDLQLKDKCVKQYLALFNGKDFRELLNNLAHRQNGYQEAFDNIRKDVRGKKLSKDEIKKQQQIDSLADKLITSPMLSKDWTLTEIVAFGNLLDQVPKEQNAKYKGIKELRKRGKWNKYFNKLQKMKIEFADILADKDLRKMTDDYIDWSFGGSSLLIMVDLLNKFASGLLPTEYVSSGAYAPYVIIENRMTRLLEDIINRIKELTFQPIVQKSSTEDQQYWERFSPKYDVTKVGELLLEKEQRGYKMTLPISLRFKNRDDRKPIWIEKFIRIGIDTILEDGRKEPYELQNQIGGTVEIKPDSETEIDYELVTWNFYAEPIMGDIVHCYCKEFGMATSVEHGRQHLKLLEPFDVKLHRAII